MSVTSRDALVLPVEDEDTTALLLLPMDDALLEVSTLEPLPKETFPLEPAVLDAPTEDALPDGPGPPVDVFPLDDDVLEPALMHSRTVSSAPGAHW